MLFIYHNGNIKPARRSIRTRGVAEKRNQNAGWLNVLAVGIICLEDLKRGMKKSLKTISRLLSSLMLLFVLDHVTNEGSYGTHS